jgi:hypothetical protein
MSIATKDNEINRALDAKDYKTALELSLPKVRSGNADRMTVVNAVRAAAALNKYKIVLDLASNEKVAPEKWDIFLLQKALRQAAATKAHRTVLECCRILLPMNQVSIELTYAAAHVLLKDKGLIGITRKLLDTASFEGCSRNLLNSLIYTAMGNLKKAAISAEAAINDPQTAKLARKALLEIYTLSDDGPNAVRIGMDLLNNTPSPPLDLALSVLRLAETHGFDAEAAKAILIAQAAVSKLTVDTTENSLRESFMLIRFGLMSLDIEFAKSVLYKLVARSDEFPPEGQERIAQALEHITKIEVFTSEFKDEFTDARDILLSTKVEAPYTEDPRCTIRFPSALFLIYSGEDMEKVRIPQRTIFLAILTALKQRGILFRIRAFLGRGRKMIWRGSGMCISYHTYGDDENCIHLKEADYLHYFTMDKNGYAGWSSFAARKFDFTLLDGIDQKEADAFVKRELEHVRASNLSKYEQAPLDELVDIVEPSVFVAMQTVNDTVQQHAWIKTLEMTKTVVDNFRGTGVTVIVKRHPKCSDPRAKKLIRDLENEQHVKISTASIHSILPLVKAFFTVNSGVGSEALYYQIPIYVFGGCDYMHACHQVHTADELKTLTSPIRGAMEPAIIRKFVFYYRNRYLVDVRDKVRLRNAIEERILNPLRIQVSELSR